MTRGAARAGTVTRRLALLLALALPPAPFAETAQTPAPCRTPPGCFSDADLQSLLDASRSRHSKGLIYVWSPHMRYSVRGAKEIYGVADALGLELTVLLDPVADSDLARVVARRERLDVRALRALASRELHARGMLLHLPAFVVYEDGRVIEAVYRGYKPRGRLTRILEERE